jgi:hypothetical protein
LGFFAEETAECFVDGDGLGWAVEDGEVGFAGGGHGFDGGAGFFAVCHGGRGEGEREREKDVGEKGMAMRLAWKERKKDSCNTGIKREL